MSHDITYVGELFSDIDNYFIVNTNITKNIRVSGTSKDATELMRRWFLDQKVTALNKKYPVKLKTFSVVSDGVEIFKTQGVSKGQCIADIKNGKYKTDRTVSTLPDTFELVEV